MNRGTLTPIVYYTLIFFIKTKSSKGYGKKVWRHCLARKVFSASELPRITPEDEIMGVHGVNFVSRGPRDILDASGVRTEIEFYFLQDSWVSKQAIYDIPCIDDDTIRSDKLFLQELEESGFIVEVHRPATDSPTITPPR